MVERRSTDGNHRSVLHLRCRGSSRRKKKTESTGQTRRPAQHTEVGTRVVKSMEDPLDFLQSGDTGDIKGVRISDKGSKPREVVVDVQGVPYWC